METATQPTGDAIKQMNSLPDISREDSPRLQEFCRVTATEVKAVGGVGAATSLEMIGYIRELEMRLRANDVAPDERERDEAFKEFWRETQSERPFDPAQPERYETFTKRYAPPAPQETPAQQEPKFDRSGLKEACQRALALGRTHQTTDIQLFLDMLLEIERYEHRDPAFQKVLEDAQAVVDCFCLGQSPEKFVEQVKGFIEDLRGSVRLARQGEGE